MLLSGCSETTLLPQESSANAAAFQTYDQVETAYTAVTPGKTTSSDLKKLGFDVKSAPNIEILSSVDIAARVPKFSKVSGRLPMQVQMCIDAQDHCIAYLFHPERRHSRHVGNAILDASGFEREKVRSGWSAEVVLLIQDDIVLYKFMTGRPSIEETERSVQPLGPLQDLGGVATGAAKPDE